MQTYCGVDIGTTNVKVLLLDAAGRVRGRVDEPTPRRNDGIGPCCDPLEIFALVEDLIIRAAADAGLRSPLCSISVAGIGEDGIEVDVAGQPLGMAIPWFDERAQREAYDLGEVAAAHAYRTGISIDAARTAAKWLWLARQRTARPADRTTWIALTDYPAFVWTGTAFLSETLAARTGCYDCIDRRWVPELLAAAQAPPLPNIAAAGQIVGTVAAGRLLQAGLADRQTLVVAGGHDHPMAASVILGINEHAVIDSMGTAELVYAESALAFKAGFPPAALPYLARSVRVDGGSGAAGLGVFELSASLRPLMIDDTERAVAMRAIVAGAPVPGEPGAGGRRFYPRAGELGGESSLDATSQSARAAFEGCTMYARRIIDATVEAGFSAGPIFTTGGWTQSPSLLTLRANVFGQAVHLVDEPQLTALGAALCGAQAAGRDGAVLRQHLSRRVVAPDVPAAAIYADLYRSYRAHSDRIGAQRERSLPIGTKS